jgi:hypothetical protein
MGVISLRYVKGIIGILFILVAVVMISGCTTNTATNKTFDYGNFSFQYPSNWTANNMSLGNQNSGETTPIVSVNPQSGGGNATIVINTFNSGTISGAKEFVNTPMSPPMTNNGTINIANTTGYTFETFDQTNNLKTKTVVFDKNGKTYMIEVTSDPSNYDYGVTAWNIIIQTFNVK